MVPSPIETKNYFNIKKYIYKRKETEKMIKVTVANTCI